MYPENANYSRKKKNKTRKKNKRNRKTTKVMSELW